MKSVKEQNSTWNYPWLSFLIKPCLAALFLLFSTGLFSQNTSQFSGEVKAKGDTIFFSNPFIVPNSLNISTENGTLDPDQYEIHYSDGYAIVHDESLKDHSFKISYRYFPDYLDKRFAFRTFRIKKDSTGDSSGIYVEEYDMGGEQMMIVPSTIRKSGSISRGISVGNSQNLSVTSGLRLQLEGDLGDGLMLQAAITDETIPIQPDGTTQQINDFDKVFIQLSHTNNRVILGDFEINHQGTNFANFYRNVQGIGVHVKQKNIEASVNGAVAKGKFHTMSFQGEEGKQGPYRLNGKNGEKFITILAGSEKVYVNGDLVTRGEGNDYVMDYNTGELIFTSQRVISSASRIVVDFEYTDRNYNRSLFFTEVKGTAFKEKLKVRGSYGRDADNHNAPIDGPFSEEAIDSLRAAGDNLLLAYISGIDTAEATENTATIRYQRRDTIVGGNVYERYVYNSNPDSAIYKITFSDVGQGNGMYVKSQGLLNGTVFEWVAPDTVTLQPQGRYAPVRFLVPAKLRQVVDVSAEYKLTDKISLYTEGAMSSMDENRFSPIDDQDNIDFANKSGVKIEKINLSDSLRLRVDVSHRYVGKRYTNIDRVYKMEYGREWNYNDLGEQLTENVSEGLVELNYGKTLRILANSGIRDYGTKLQSIKQLYEVESRHKILQGKYKFTTITTDDQALNTLSRWTRHNGDIYKRIWKFQPGSEIWMEDKTNESNGVQNNGAFRFYDFKPYLKTVSSSKVNLYLYYNYRKEYEVKDSIYRQKSEAHTEYMKIIASPFDGLNIQNTSSLRQYNLLDTIFSASGLENTQTFITNFQASWFTPKRVIFSNLLYEITSEQLARKQVAYIEVNPGQGDYEWIDADSNGVQSLDEFQYSINPTRSNFFIRVLIPTSELFPTTTINFSGNLKLDFKKAWARSDNPFKETVRNLSAITNYRVVQKKDAGNNFEDYIVDFGNVFGDTSLLDAQYIFRQDLYIFRNHQTGDLKFSYGDNKSKLFLSSGPESRSLKFYSGNQRLNFGKSKSLENEVQIGNKTTRTASFASRNYNIDFWEVKPTMNFQISRKLRISTGYEYKHKVNTADTTENLTTVNIHKIKFDTKINLKNRNNIFAKVELLKIAQEGNAGFSAEYELRESLQPGYNAVWQVFTTVYLTQALEMSVTYDGRASEGKKVLHSGRLQLKAYF